MHCKEWLFLVSNRPQSHHRISLWAHGEKLYYVQWLIMKWCLILLSHAEHCCPGSPWSARCQLTWSPRLLSSASPLAIRQDNAPEYGCLGMSHPRRALGEPDQRERVCACVCVWVSECKIKREERWGFVHTHQRAIFLTPNILFVMSIGHVLGRCAHACDSHIVIKWYILSTLWPDYGSSHKVAAIFIICELMQVENLSSEHQVCAICYLWSLCCQMKVCQM